MREWLELSLGSEWLGRRPRMVADGWFRRSCERWWFLGGVVRGLVVYSYEAGGGGWVVRECGNSVSGCAKCGE